MQPVECLVLLGAGVVAGVFNAIAGGGSFFTFPALIWTGLPAVIANTTSALSVWPGHAGAAVGARRALRPRVRALASLALACAAGGLIGAALLLFTPHQAFRNAVPWLVLAATALFAAGPVIHRRIAAGSTPRLSAILSHGLLFLASIYGGFFGAGLGILLMAVLGLTRTDTFAVSNAVKNLLATIITTASILVFASTGNIAWTQAAPVLAGALVGGFIGARIAAHVSGAVLRGVVIATGLVLFVFFLRQH